MYCVVGRLAPTLTVSGYVNPPMQDVEEIVKRLYSLYDVSGVSVRFYAPQLANFLINSHVRSPHREELELLLLSKCEQSVHFAHRLFFFLNSWGHDVAYGSDLSGPATIHNKQPLLRSVEVQGAIAAARLAQSAGSNVIQPRLAGISALTPAQHRKPQDGLFSPSNGANPLISQVSPPPGGTPESRGGDNTQQHQYRDNDRTAADAEPTVAIVISGPYASHQVVTPAPLALPVASPLLSPSSSSGAVIAGGSGSASGASSAFEGLPAPLVATLSASTRAEASRFAAPPPMSPALVAALDNRSMALFYRVRANLTAAASASAAAQLSNVAQSAIASSNSRTSSTEAIGGSMHSGSGSTAGGVPVQLVQDDDADIGSGAQASATASTPVNKHLSSALASGTGAGNGGGRGRVMQSLGSPDVRNTGPLMPAGGAASSLAFGAGGLAAFRETINLFLELARVSSLMTSVPIPSRNSVLRASLDAVSAHYLPSRAAYVPLGNVHNRLVAIHSAHSFCFKTAKRAPFMVVFELVDFATTSGFPLDRDDSEDDDEARDRARKRREVSAEADARTRRETRKLRIRQFRQRAGTLQGPGGAAAAAAAAAELVAEGMRDAADRVNEGMMEIGEVMQERAVALKDYVKRKVDKLKDVPRLHPNAALASQQHGDGEGFVPGHGGGLLSPAPASPPSSPNRIRMARPGASSVASTPGRSTQGGVSRGFPLPAMQALSSTDQMSSTAPAGCVGRARASSGGGSRGAGDAGGSSLSRALRAPFRSGSRTGSGGRRGRSADGTRGSSAAAAGSGKPKIGKRTRRQQRALAEAGDYASMDALDSDAGAGRGGTAMSILAGEVMSAPADAHALQQALESPDGGRGPLLSGGGQGARRGVGGRGRIGSSAGLGLGGRQRSHSEGETNATPVAGSGYASGGNEGYEHDGEDADEGFSDADAEAARVLLDGQSGTQGRIARMLRRASSGSADDVVLETDSLWRQAATIGKGLTMKGTKAIRQSIRLKPSLRNIARRTNIVRASEMRRGLVENAAGASNEAGTEDGGDGSGSARSASGDARAAASKIRRAMKKGANAMINRVFGDAEDDNVVTASSARRSGGAPGGDDADQFEIGGSDDDDDQHGEYAEVSDGPSDSRAPGQSRPAVITAGGPGMTDASAGGATGLATNATVISPSGGLMHEIDAADAESRVQQMGQWSSGVPSQQAFSNTATRAHAGSAFPFPSPRGAVHSEPPMPPSLQSGRGASRAQQQLHQPFSNPMRSSGGQVILSPQADAPLLSVRSPSSMPSPAQYFRASSAGAGHASGSESDASSSVAGSSRSLASAAGAAGAGTGAAKGGVPLSNMATVPEESLVEDKELERELREGLPVYGAEANEVDPDAVELPIASAAVQQRRHQQQSSRGATAATADANDIDVVIQDGSPDGAGASPSAAVAGRAQDFTSPAGAAAAAAGASGSGYAQLPLSPPISQPGSSAGGVELTAAGAADGGAQQQEPIAVVFPERWREKEAMIAATSAYSHLPGWRLLPVIIKSNDDLRQEQFVSQLLVQFSAIFRQARVPVWVKPYDILAISPDAGLVQAIPDTISLDSLKRGDPFFTTLDNWFERHFNCGSRGAERVRVARMNFARSLAAYSIICYILQIKDRHNGNILIDRRGHVLHIDFGFLFTNSPGGNIGFEAAPFKLTSEFVDVLGGPRSSLFNTFRKLCVRTFLAVRKHRERIILLVQMMLAGNDHLPCFVGGARAVMSGLRARFREDADERQCVTYVHRLIDSSIDDWRTRWYDAYQRYAQGVMS